MYVISARQFVQECVFCAEATAVFVTKRKLNVAQ